MVSSLINEVRIYFFQLLRTSSPTMEQRLFVGPFRPPMNPRPTAQVMNGPMQGPSFFQPPFGSLPSSQFQSGFPPAHRPGPPVAPPGIHPFGVPILPPSHLVTYVPQVYVPPHQLNFNAPSFSPSFLPTDRLRAPPVASNADKLPTGQPPVAIATSKPGINQSASSSTPTNPSPTPPPSSSSSSTLELGVPTSVIFIEGSPASLQLQLKNEALIGSIQNELRTAAIDRNFSEKFAMKREPQVAF